MKCWIDCRKVSVSTLRSSSGGKWGLVPFDSIRFVCSCCLFLCVFVINIVSFACVCVCCVLYTDVFAILHHWPDHMCFFVCVVNVVCVLIQWIYVRIHTNLGFLLLFEYKNCLFVFVLVLVVEYNICLWLKQLKSSSDSQTSSFINSKKELHTFWWPKQRKLFEHRITFTWNQLFNRYYWSSHTLVFLFGIIGTHIEIFMLYWPTVS